MTTVNSSNSPYGEPKLSDWGPMVDQSGNPLTAEAYNEAVEQKKRELSQTPVDPNSGDVEMTSFKDMLDSIELPANASIQLRFARFQLAYAQMCKTNAESYMNKIEAIQDEQSECAEMVALARSLQDSGKDLSTNETLAAYFKKHNLSVKSGTSEEVWAHNIQSLTNYQESIGNKTQTMMVYMQDFLSQYNSYLQGANTAIQEAASTMRSILTGR